MRDLIGPPERHARWRLVDSGVRPAVQNLALSRAMCESRIAGETANTLHFFASEPAAIVGCTQSAAQELDVEQCRREGIPIVRAADASPARFVDERQLGWEIFVRRADLYRRDRAGIVLRLAGIVCDALAAFGVDARLRAGSEFEVGGRRIGDLQVTLEGAFAWCRGSLLLDFQPERAERVLRSALGRTALPEGEGAVAFRMADRVTSLRDVLGLPPSATQVRRTLADALQHCLGARYLVCDLADAEQARYRIALREFASPDWVGLVRRPGSEMPIVAATAQLDRMTLHAGVAYDLRGRRLREACLMVEPACLPAPLLRDLEVALRGVAIDALAPTVRRFFVAREVDLGGLRPGDFSALVIRAVMRPERVLSG